MQTQIKGPPINARKTNQKFKSIILYSPINRGFLPDIYLFILQQTSFWFENRAMNMV